MANNRGKQFEGVIKEAFLKVKGCSINRIPDQMNGFKGGNNICDFIAYKYPYIMYLECKSIKGNTFPFSNITQNQWEGLFSKSFIPGAISGVIVWWLDKNITKFIPMRLINELSKQGMKSIRYDDDYGYEIPGRKKRVLFEYDMKEFLEELFDAYESACFRGQDK